LSTDWIKMRVDLRTHPKVVRMAGALSADKLRVVGGLHAVWSIFDAHSTDGLLDGYTFKALDIELGWKGFSQAMADIGWLIDSGGHGLEAPRFEEHNGQSAKRRAMETERKRIEREAEKAASDAAKSATKAGQASASDADKSVTREEKRREEQDKEKSNLPVAPALPSEDRPQLTLVEPPTPGPTEPPPCPHLEVLALWAEMLPTMPQHLPKQWKGARADHLRTRWRETAVDEGWREQAEGLRYLRRLFAYVGKSPFLTGRVKPRDGKPPFVIELEWLVMPSNWAKVIEGKYHQESA
jgi:hypothetical protein